MIETYKGRYLALAGHIGNRQKPDIGTQCLTFIPNSKGWESYNGKGKEYTDNWKGNEEEKRREEGWRWEEVEKKGRQDSKRREKR